MDRSRLRCYCHDAGAILALRIQDCIFEWLFGKLTDPDREMESAWESGLEFRRPTFDETDPFAFREYSVERVHSRLVPDRKDLMFVRIVSSPLTLRVDSILEDNKATKLRVKLIFPGAGLEFPLPEQRIIRETAKDTVTDLDVYGRFELELDRALAAHSKDQAQEDLVAFAVLMRNERGADLYTAFHSTIHSIFTSGDYRDNVTKVLARLWDGPFAGNPMRDHLRNPKTEFETKLLDVLGPAHAQQDTNVARMLLRSIMPIKALLAADVYEGAIVSQQPLRSETAASH